MVEILKKQLWKWCKSEKFVSWKLFNVLNKRKIRWNFYETNEKGIKFKKKEVLNCIKL